MRRTCLRRGGLAVPGTTQEKPRERLPRQPRRRGQGARAKHVTSNLPTHSNFSEMVRMNAAATRHLKLQKKNQT